MGKTFQTKCNRKARKYQMIFSQLYNDEPSGEPTQTLMVCNVGLSSLDKSDLFSFFSAYGAIDDIQMPVSASHSFVKFQSLDSAKQCFDAVNGKLSIAQMNGPLFLLYLKSRSIWFSVPILPDISQSYNLPPGARIIEDFINEEEEQILINFSMKALDAINVTLKQRKVIHFGYEFLYGSNNVDRSSPLAGGIPVELDFINTRLEMCGFELSWKPDQVTVNHYLPGQGIPPHIDSHSPFEDPILSLSLGSDTVMDFTHASRTNTVSAVLPRRAMLIMSEASRYAWFHGIAAKKRDLIPGPDRLQFKERGVRISFTFRKTRDGPCQCKFPSFCDSRLGRNYSRSDAMQAQDLENQYVHEVYECISDQFSNTRHSPWPRVLEFVQSCPLGSIVVDVGCGNGKYFGFNHNVFEVGCERSSGLAKITRSRGFETVRTDCLQLPFRDESADAVLCIAVIHHLSSRERRSAAVREILRVLRATGRALIYVWARDQAVDESSTYLKQTQAKPQPLIDIKETHPFPVHRSGTNFIYETPDVLVPWKKQKSTYLRFYHVFEANELDELCVSSGAHVVSSYYDNGNWCVMLTKGSNV